MKPKIHFIERKPDEFYSVEKVFRQIAENLNEEKFGYSFTKMPFLSSFSGMIKNFASFRRPASDIYHITGDVHYMTLLLPADKTVLTIHDLNILRTRTGLRRFVLKKLLFDFPVRKLKFITAISEATKKEIIFYTNCAAAKIRVIENPVDEKLFKTVEKDFNRKCPNILHIGTAPHKNLSNLIRAVEGIACHLTIIGKIDDETATLLREKKIEYSNKFNLDDFGIQEEYKNADIVAFCSLFEGFGLPIAEAQATRTPLLTSNIEPMRSVAGEGAYLCDPRDYLSIRAGIKQIIENSELRVDLVRKGMENVARFRPEHIAAKYESLYAEMLSERN